MAVFALKSDKFTYVAAVTMLLTYARLTEVGIVMAFKPVTILPVIVTAFGSASWNHIYFGPNLELFSEHTRFREDEIEQPLNRKLLLHIFLLCSDKSLGSQLHFELVNILVLI